MMTNEPKIAVIILNWNGKKDTLQCLESLQNVQYSNYEIIVVDNGSKDNSVEAIQHQFSAVTVIENGINLGFAGGNNPGISYAVFQRKADYVFLLNNDTIVDPQIFNRLICASKTYPEAGIFGAKIYFFDMPTKIWYAGSIWNSRVGRFAHEGINQMEDNLSWSQVKEVPYACGCALLIRANVIEEIGLLDSQYFLMWEETDWCFRAKRAGYRCLFVPDALVWHKVSSSFGKTSQQLAGVSYLWTYFYERNRLLWLERHLDLIEKNGLKRLRIYLKVIREIVGNARRYFFYKCLDYSTVQPHTLRYQVVLRAHQDYLLRRFGDCPDWIRSLH